MSHQTAISSEEIRLVNRVAGKFIRRMRWNPRWEAEDVRQELLCFWIQTKENGWNQPEDWQCAMGRCLNLHLKDLIKHACARKRQAEHLSLDQMLEDGHDFPAPEKSHPLQDFFKPLSRFDRQICNLLLQGKTKLEISSLLNRSRPFIDQRLKHVRHLTEDFLQI